MYQLLPRILHLGLIVVLASRYYAINRTYSMDDSFITYRYAYHLKEGFGLVFNVGEAYYGTTAAGYAVLLAGMSAGTDFLASMGLAAFGDLTVQNVSVALSALFLGVVCACLPVIARADGSPARWALCAAATLYLFAGPVFNGVPGHETYAFLGLGTLATVLLERGWRASAGGAVAVATAFRPDAALLAILLPLLDWARTGGSPLPYVLGGAFRRYAVGAGSVMAAWCAFLLVHFGTVVPGTMDAKRAQVDMNLFQRYNVTALFEHFRDFGSWSLWLLAVGLVGFAIALLVRRASSPGILGSGSLFTGIVWLAFGVGSALVYFSMRVTYWGWYGIPVSFAAGLAAFAGVKFLLDAGEAATSAAMRRLGGPVSIARVVGGLPSLVIVMALVWQGLPALTVWHNTPQKDWPHSRAYREIGDWLKLNEPQGTVIQMPEPGAFGIYLGPKYQIVDELGLITPGVAKAFLRGDRDYADRVYQAKYLICGWPGLYSGCSKPTLTRDFELVGEFDLWFWKPPTGHGAYLYRRVARPSDQPAT